MKNIFNKLLAVQKEVGAIKRDSDNPYFKSKYFDINGLLAELKPILNKHDVVVIQPLTMIEGRPAITTTIIDPESGEEMASTIQLPDVSDPQKMGSAITYFRRYSLQSLFLLEAEDDDGNTASGQGETEKPEVRSQPATPGRYPVTNNQFNPSAMVGRQPTEGQRYALKRNGYTDEQIDHMDRLQASQAIDKIKSAGSKPKTNSQVKSEDAVEHDIGYDPDIPVIDNDEQ